MVADELEKDFLYNSKLLYEALIKSTDEFIYICNMKTGEFRYTPGIVKEFALPGEIIKDPFPYWKTIVHPDDWESFYQSNLEIGEDGKDKHHVEFRALSRSGEYQWLRCRGYLARDEEGQPAVFAGVLSRLDRKPKIDQLTSLYTSSVFAEDFARMKEENVFGEIGLFILGIDRFRHINECYGRAEGDKVIKTAARIISELIPEGIRAYRLEGDQFGIIVKYPTEMNVKRLYKAIRSRFQCYRGQGDTRLVMTVSAGYSEYPKDGKSYIDLYKYADYALRYAKERGRDRLEMFSQEILEHKSRKLKLLRLIREDISEGFRGFSLTFLPIVERQTMRIRGAEAVVCWKNECIEEVRGQEFLQILEENRLINPLGKWMFQEGCRTLKKWKRAGWNLELIFRLSYAQFCDEVYTDGVLQIVECSEISPQNIVIEVSDDYPANDPEAFGEAARILKENGVQIMLDNFVTDYRTIEMLKENLIDIVKVDRTIFSESAKSNLNQEYIRFVSNICHGMDAKVCLKGMKEMEDLEEMEEPNFDYMQGELFGKPQTAEKLLQEWMYL